MRRAGLALIGLLLLTGCAEGAAAPTPTVTVTAEAAPATTPTTEPAAVERGPGTPIDRLDAYALCKAQNAMQHTYGDPTDTTRQPFEEATIVARDDGNWYVAMLTEDSGNPELGTVYGADYCVVGGTVGDPVWVAFGSMSRGGLDQEDPNKTFGE